MIGFLISTALLIVVIGVGCKKKEKNNATKLKPRNMSKDKAVPKSPDTNKKSPATSPTPEAEKSKIPEPDDTPALPPREADDNETINEAPSLWATVDKNKGS